MALGQLFLSNQRMRLAVPQIPWGRTNQFSNLVGVLKLRAIHLDDCARVPEQKFTRCFPHASFARACWAQQEEIPHRPPRRVQSCAEDLVQVHERLHSFRLSDDLRPQRRLKFNRRVASQIWIEWQYLGAHGLLLTALHPQGRMTETSTFPVKLTEFYLEGECKNRSRTKHPPPP